MDEYERLERIEEAIRYMAAHINQSEVVERILSEERDPDAEPEKKKSK